MRLVPRLPRRLPDRRLSRTLPARCAALHLLPHHREQGADPARIPRGDRQPHLWLRRLPRRLPVEQVRADRIRGEARRPRRSARAGARRPARARRCRLPGAVLGLAGQAHRPRPLLAQRADRRRQFRRCRACRRLPPACSTTRRRWCAARPSGRCRGCCRTAPSTRWPKQRVPMEADATCAPNGNAAPTGRRRCGKRSGGMTPRFFIFGAGYSGRAFAAAGRRAKLSLPARRARRKNSSGCARAGIEPYQFDGEAISDEVRSALADDDASRHLDRAERGRRSGARLPAATMLASDMPAPALDRLSLDRRRLWRPWRRLGRRGERMPAGVAPLGAARRGRTGLAVASGASAGVPVAVLGCPASTARAAMLSSTSPTARRGGWSSRARCSTASMSPTSPARSGIWRGRETRRRLQRHRRPAGAAAGRRRLCRGIDGDRAAARNSVRDRPTFAHGAVLLWREQARFERGDQGRRVIAFAFPDYRSAFDACGPSGDWRGDGEGDAASPIKPS